MGGGQMSTKLLFMCDRQGCTEQTSYPLNPQRETIPEGWDKVRGLLLCPNCLVQLGRWLTGDKKGITLR